MKTVLLFCLLALLSSQVLGYETYQDYVVVKAALKTAQQVALIEEMNLDGIFFSLLDSSLTHPLPLSFCTSILLAHHFFSFSHTALHALLLSLLSLISTSILPSSFDSVLFPSMPFYYLASSPLRCSLSHTFFCSTKLYLTPYSLLLSFLVWSNDGTPFVGEVTLMATRAQIKQLATKGIHHRYIYLFLSLLHLLFG